MSSEGQSKGFGFVRFSNEADYRAALSQNHNLNILGSKAINIRAAKPRRPKLQTQYKPNPPYFGQDPHLPQPTQTPEAVYASETNVNPVYSGYPITANPYWFYGYMPYNALQYGYDPYAYGQQMYVQQFYPVCDTFAYPSIPSQTFIDHGHNQFIDTDKLNDEMIAKNEVSHPSSPLPIVTPFFLFLGSLRFDRKFSLVFICRM